MLLCDLKNLTVNPFVISKDNGRNKKLLENIIKEFMDNYPLFYPAMTQSVEGASLLIT